MKKELLSEIIHTLRTPSVAIQSSSNAIKYYLPILVEAYKVAKKQNLNVPEVQVQHLSLLEKVVNNIENEAATINKILDELIILRDSIDE